MLHGVTVQKLLRHCYITACCFVLPFSACLSTNGCSDSRNTRLPAVAASATARPSPPPPQARCDTGSATSAPAASVSRSSAAGEALAAEPAAPAAPPVCWPPCKSALSLGQLLPDNTGAATAVVSSYTV